MAIIGDPQREWELPAPLDIPSDTPLETDDMPVVVPERETVEV